MNKTILILIVLAILGIGAYSMNMNKSAQQENTAKTEITPSPEQKQEATGSMEKKEMKEITMTEIEKHATKTDCWFAIEGKVYDVTGFIASGKHGGGDAIIDGCGKDATQMFTMRPQDGKPHSDMAKGFLPNFQIGTLVK